MTDNEIDVAWSRMVATLAADALLSASVIVLEDVERASAIIAEEFYVRLAMQDRPDRENWRYRSDELPGPHA